MGEVDVSGKWLLGEAPEEWVRWMLADPTLEVEEFLTAEFRHVLRHSDALLRVRDVQGPFLLLVELQLHYDPKMPWRMQAYAALAEEKYGLPVYPLVFYLLPPSSGVSLPDRYYSEFRGLVARRDFRVVKAWELGAGGGGAGAVGSGAVNAVDERGGRRCGTRRSASAEGAGRR
jgi:predicted transposase YdaD